MQKQSAMKKRCGFVMHHNTKPHPTKIIQVKLKCPSLIVQLISLGFLSYEK